MCDSVPHGWVSSSATLLDTFAEEAARRTKVKGGRSVKRSAEGRGGGGSARATSLTFHWDLVSHIGSVINYGGKQAA